jgi:hypothetical protein
MCNHLSSGPQRAQAQHFCEFTNQPRLATEYGKQPQMTCREGHQAMLMMLPSSPKNGGGQHDNCPYFLETAKQRSNPLEPIGEDLRRHLRLHYSP